VGGGGDTTTVQKSDPWSGIQPYLMGGYQQLSQAAQQTPSYYPGQTYAGFDPYQTQALTQQAAYAGSDQLNNAVNGQFSALNYGLNSVYDPQSNPVLQDYVASATRPLTEAYQNTVGNAIAGNAVGAGSFGGSRQGVAEGLASRAYQNAVGDVSTGIYNNAYNQGLDQQARMAALAPQVMQAGLMPSQFLGDVGSQQQNQAQLGINEAMNRYNYNQDAPYNRASSYVSTLAGTPWGTSSATGPDPNASNPVIGALGGAGLGYGAASLLGGTSGAAATMALPYAWPLVIGGGLLGAFG
jgi:hypothetical protein